MHRILENIKIELTDNCPLDCLHCSSNASVEGKVFLNVNVVKNVIQDAKRYGLKKIVFSGGEPLLYPQIYELISFCSNLEIKTTLYSTGIDSINLNYCTNSKIEELKKLGLNRIVFSLFSSIKDEHENITRISGSFNATLNSIRESVKQNLITELHFIPTKQNFKSLENLVDLVLKLGINRISILRFVPHGRGTIIKDISSLTKRENLAFRVILKGIIKKHPDLIRLGSPYNFLLLRDCEKCDAGINQLIINPNGFVFPCDAFKNIYPKDLGINDTYNSIMDNSINEIWQKSKYLNFIRTTINENKKEPCLSCTSLEKCESGCLAQKIINNNSFYGKDPDCIIDGG